MGPMMMATAQNGHTDPRAQLEEIIDNLLNKIWEIMVQLNEYSSENKWAILNSLQDLTGCLDDINRLQEKIKHIKVPMTVIDYIDEGRNPDIFMSEYVEEVMTENNVVNVKNEAIIDFKGMLLEQLQETFPEQTDAYKKCVQMNNSDLPATNGH
ncbi:5086_t:CDS:2 [Acaulospora morrowiae]|uniref:Mediator of RNA polymerase II transcription subunit 10 n=1 Tax=Acaulospora morrowiae TaxID=94023 RepID=A0A9N8WQG6_9GLOM|nr:5086_t:CDS:2 [Acaulospora morrowiae]